MNSKSEIVIIAEKRQLHSEINMYSEELDFSSLKVTTDIINAIESLDYPVVYYDSPTSFVQNITQHRNSIVFTNLWGGRHSRNKRAYLPAICEASGLRYVGADAFTQLLCQDKYLAKLYLADYRFSIPRAKMVSNIDELEQVLNHVFYPCVIKPNDEGCSVGISDNSIAFSADEAEKVARNLLEHYTPILLEEFIGGREISICCAGKDNNIDILEAIELNINGQSLTNRIWGYETKKMGAGIVQRANVTAKMPQWVLDEAVRLFNSLGKVDCMRIDGKFYNDKFYIIELSPDCSLHKDCFMANAFYSAGYTYAAMLDKLISYAEKSS